MFKTQCSKDDKDEVQETIVEEEPDSVSKIFSCSRFSFSFTKPYFPAISLKSLFGLL